MKFNLRLSIPWMGLLLAGFWPWAGMGETGAREVPLADNLVCTVVPGQISIPAGSPLLVELKVENRGKELVLLEQPLGELYGTAIVQIMRPGESHFDEVRTSYTGRKHVAGYRGVINPGEHVVAHTLLFADSGGALVFGAPGRYELRARLRAGSVQPTSFPVVIDVQESDPSVEKALNSVRADWTHVSLHETLHAKRLARIRGALGHLAPFEHCLAYIEGLSELTFGGKGAHARGVQKLEGLRTPAELQWNNLVTGVLAIHCARTGDLEGAKELLRQSPMRSRLTDQARQILKNSSGAE